MLAKVAEPPGGEPTSADLKEDIGWILFLFLKPVKLPIDANASYSTRPEKPLSGYFGLRRGVAVD